MIYYQGKPVTSEPTTGVIEYEKAYWATIEGERVREFTEKEYVEVLGEEEQT